MTTPIRLGVLRLTDSAPAVLAAAHGLFIQEGVEVRLHVEPSWANLLDKLAWGALDAAIVLAPLAIAASAGLRGTKLRIRIPMGISRGGNTIVASPALSAALPQAGSADMARALAAWLSRQTAAPRFGVVHHYSSHHLLLQTWLAGAGMDAARSLEIVVVPPERVVTELQAGRIVGFCAGAPWGDHAETMGAGRVLLGGSAIRGHHLEKCLAVTELAAQTQRDAVHALIRALTRAQRRCDDPAETPGLSHLLAEWLDLPADAVPAALPDGRGIEKISFSDATTLDMADMSWFAKTMVSLGWLPEMLAQEALSQLLTEL